MNQDISRQVRRPGPQRVQSQAAHYPDRDDVTGAVDDWEAGVHQHLPHELDVALVLAAKHPALGALQDPHRLQRSSQQHGRQGGGEDEARCIGPDGVNQGTRAGDVPSNTAKGFAWEETGSFITATAQSVHSQALQSLRALTLLFLIFKCPKTQIKPISEREKAENVMKGS